MRRGRTGAVLAVALSSVVACGPVPPVSVFPTAPAPAVGIDPSAAERVDATVARRYPEVRSVLVARRARLAVERYYGGARAEEAAPIASATKSVLSALVGIALRDGLLPGLDETLAGVFPTELADVDDPRKRGITLRQLLSMTSGFAWGPEQAAGLQDAADPVGYLLNLPLVDEPGEVFTYKTVDSQLVSAALTRVTGVRAETFARRELFEPLGIRTEGREGYSWLTDRGGDSTGALGLSLTPRDLAQIGQLYLQGGRWERRQLIPRWYVEASTSRQSAGGTLPGETPYGLGWWVTSVDGRRAYFAAGFGGQFIQVVPHLDLVVVITSGTREPGNRTRDLIATTILPALEDQGPKAGRRGRRQPRRPWSTSVTTSPTTVTRPRLTAAAPWRCQRQGRRCGG